MCCCSEIYFASRNVLFGDSHLYNDSVTYVLSCDNARLKPSTSCRHFRDPSLEYIAAGRKKKVNIPTRMFKLLKIYIFVTHTHTHTQIGEGLLKYFKEMIFCNSWGNFCSENCTNLLQK